MADQRAKPACKVHAPLAPVQARAAVRTPARATGHRGIRIQPQAPQGIRDAVGHMPRAGLVVKHHRPRLQQMIRDRHTEAARQVVVTRASGAQSGIARAHDHAARRQRRLGRYRQLHQAFEHTRHLGRSQAVVTMPPLALHAQQQGVHQQAQVAAGGGGRDVGRIGQFARGQCAPIHQRHQHGRAGGFADQGGDVRDAVGVHGPSVLQARASMLRSAAKHA
ncbi:hypothetical protein FQZ97_962060 [compost metagenome]